MARTQARVLVSIWTSDDWRALPKPVQWLYEALLTQSRLNLAGCIDLMPARWATLSAGDTTEAIEADLAALEAAGFVAVDRSTGEVVIRTFAKHDLCVGIINKNLIKGYWSAWSGILSPYLRSVVVHNTPDMLWEKDEALVPELAKQTRRSPRLEPTVATDGPNRRSEPSLDLLYRCPQTTTDAAVHRDTLTAAARIVAERQADLYSDIVNRGGWVADRVPKIRAENEQAWRRRLEADPSLTAEQLTAAPKPTLVRDPTDTTAAATAARYELAEAKRRGEVCERCEGQGVYFDDDLNAAVECACKRAASA